jgi:glycosyltransferase involved in cell wall biosynthesis
MRRLRVAIVLPGFVEARDDHGLPAVVDLVERVAAAHDTHVVALRHPPARPAYRVAGATVDALGGGRAAGPWGRGWILARGIAQVLRIHRRRPLDLVHGLWADEAGAVATLAARLIGRPAIVSVMGGELVRMENIGYGAGLGRGGRWTASLALRGAAIVTAGSSIVLAQVLARRPSADVELFPLGVDTKLFSPGPTPPHAAARILFVGSLEPVKGPALLIRAFAGLLAGLPAGQVAGLAAGLAPSHPEVSLEIVGEGSLRRPLEHLAAQLGIAERVTFHGRLARTLLPEAYRSATVLAVPSRHEAQSMVAIEAAACGIPVVGTHVGALPDLGEGALTVPVGDAASLTRALARALATVLDDPARASSMGAAGRAVAVERYDLDHTSRALLGVYDDLVTEGSRRRRRSASA